MRPLWKGAVSFGLVYVPIKLYTATESKDIRFNFLHNKCKNPIKNKRYCTYCQKEVSTDEIVRGYEYEKGKYVILKDEDFENLPDRESKNIEIIDFVDLKEIDPVYYQKAYYVVPGEGGGKVYELLKNAMEKTGKAAVSRIMIRTKESLAVIRVVNNAIMMNTMFYPDEVRKPEQLPEMNFNVKLHKNELKMAENLIENLSAKFKPEKYTNEYRKELMEIIQAKIAGKEIETPQEEAEDRKVVDLMEALKASIEKTEEEKKKTDKKVKKKKTGS